ncbi:MAG: hypothetical protein ACOYL5_04075 [Phototrophicaceae bacterium]
MKPSKWNNAHKDQEHQAPSDKEGVSEVQMFMDEYMINRAIKHLQKDRQAYAQLLILEQPDDVLTDEQKAIKRKIKDSYLKPSRFPRFVDRVIEAVHFHVFVTYESIIFLLNVLFVYIRVGFRRKTDRKRNQVQQNDEHEDR